MLRTLLVDVNICRFLLNSRFQNQGKRRDKYKNKKEREKRKERYHKEVCFKVVEIVCNEKESLIFLVYQKLKNLET